MGRAGRGRPRDGGRFGDPRRLRRLHQADRGRVRLDPPTALGGRGAVALRARRRRAHGGLARRRLGTPPRHAPRNGHSRCRLRARVLRRPPLADVRERRRADGRRRRRARHRHHIHDRRAVVRLAARPRPGHSRRRHVRRPDARRPALDAADQPLWLASLVSLAGRGHPRAGAARDPGVRARRSRRQGAPALRSRHGRMGAMNIVGTVASGWICDRFGRKGPLAIYYGVRGLSLIFLLYVWNVPSLHVFAAIFGLNYISTVPPTTTLTANIFGRLSVGALSGWIFFSHQVGSAIGAWAGGAIFDATGSYSWAFLSAAVLAFGASGLSLLIKEVPISAQPTRRPTPEGAPVAAG